MGKKRKVWWIVGGALGFVVLYLATALFVSLNDADARMEVTLNEIIEQYDFVDGGSGAIILGGFAEPLDSYISQDRTSGETDEIVRRLMDTCQDCSYRLADPIYELRDSHIFETGDSYRNVGIVHVVPRIAAADDEGRMTVEIFVGRRDRWSVLEYVWPW